MAETAAPEAAEVRLGSRAARLLSNLSHNKSSK
jgi:hypothetical protein